MKKKSEKIEENPQNVVPMQVMIGSETETRRNKAATNERSDRFKNIENGFIPFSFSGSKNTSGVTIRDIVMLCRKAYYNIPIFRNVIDLMTEFSVGEIHWKGGSKKSREFFKALFKKLGDWKMQDGFYREYYRSGNVFELRMDGQITNEDFKKITQIFGAIQRETGIKLPVRYIILNPEDIHLTGSIIFGSNQYHQILSDYELEKLRKPSSEKEIELLKSLGPKVNQLIKSGASGGVMIPLDPTKLTAIFYKKQDYEPFATPMGYGVLADINWKEEMKRIDMAISRTMQQVILLITMGESKKDGGMGVSQDNINAMQSLFQNQSAGRVLVSDYTTKGQWLIPDIGTFLNPVKYEIVNRDIQVGLNYVLFGDEKFANQQTKVKVFVERLKEGRKAFLEEFIIPEVKRISKDLGMKNFPTPYYEDVNLQDDVELARIYTRLAELGILTPDETIEAINDNKLPTVEESRESQEQFRGLRDKGYYQPIVNSPYDQMKIAKETAKLKPQPQSSPKMNGRPSGAKAPQTTKKIKPLGASFSVEKIVENMKLAEELEKEMVNFVKEKNNIKKINSEQKTVLKEILATIISNEAPENWSASISKYIENPDFKNEEYHNEIDEICAEHNIKNRYLGTILFHSKAEECQENE